MDWKFTPEEEAFREELRGFLSANLPADWNDASFTLPATSEERNALADKISQSLADRQWLAMA